VVFQEQTRRRLRGGGLALFTLGLFSLGFGIAAPHLAPDRAPVPVAYATASRLPGTGPFGGTLALYGNPAGTVPPAPQFGCTVRDASGRPAGGRLTQDGLGRLDRRVVDDRPLLPVLRVTDPSPEQSLTCTGPAARETGPLYLIATTGQRDLVPMAAFSFATCAIVLGVAATIALRPID
jgi:hypothetical protein